MTWTEVSSTTTSNWQSAAATIGDIVFDAAVAFDADVPFDGGGNPDILWEDVNAVTTSQWTSVS